MAARPWNDADDEALKAGHAAGTSLHELAKTMGRSKATLSVKAKDLGLTWDRADTVTATTAKVRDAKSRQAEAHLRELQILEHQQQRILDVYTGSAKHKTKLRGEGGAEEFVEVNFLPPQDDRDLAGARSASSTVIGRLAAQTDDGADHVRSLLGGLAARFGLTADAPDA